MPQIVSSHPYISVVGVVATASMFSYAIFSNYTKECDNYKRFNDIESPASNSKSLEEFLKYRLQHNETSYVKLGETCNDNDQKVSLFTTEIINDLSLSSEENQLNIVLCSGQVSIDQEQ